MDIYTYEIRVFAPVAESPDLTGYDVEASDGHIGKVDEATHEESGSCLVVNTGFWIFGRKRMVPAGVVRRIDPEEKKVFLNMTKDQIKHAPDYDADRHRLDEKGYHKEVGEYYQPHVS